MFYSYILSLNIIILVHSFIFKFETSCDSSQFMDLENLIGSLHRYAPGHGHLIVRDMGLTIGQLKLLKIYQNIEIISSKYKQTESIEIINVKHEFFLVNNTLANRNNSGKYNHIDSIRKRFYLALVMPFIESQFDGLIDQLNFQNTYPPCRNKSNSIDLILYHNEKTSSILDNRIRQIDYPNNCFKSIRFFAANLSEKENQYPVGSAIMWQKLFINERFNNISLRYHGYTHFFLMEPDARPIRSYWLDGIVEHIVNGHDRESYFSTQWWMIGSIYRGSESIGQHFLHINGNALYHLSLSFIQYIEYVSSEYPFDSRQSLGYDLDLFSYLFKDIDRGKKFWHKFQFTDLIQNCWHSGCDETNIEFLFHNPNTYLIHGHKVEEKLYEKILKKFDKGTILIILVVLLFVFIKRFRYFCWKLVFKPMFSLRIISK